jgi:hypothetical protein
VAALIGVLLVVYGVLDDQPFMWATGAFVVLLALASSRMESFEFRAPFGWFAKGETITSKDLVAPSIELSRERGATLAEARAEEIAREVLPEAVYVKEGTVSRDAIVTALAEKVVAEAGHYAFCPRCGFNMPLMKGEIFEPTLCPACGKEELDRSDRPSPGPPMY